MPELPGEKSYYSGNYLARKVFNARPGIEMSPWGANEMTVINPFFNRLFFYEQVEL